MRTKQLLISLVLGLGLTLVLLWLLGGTALPTVHASASQCPDQRPLLQAGGVITVCLSGGCDYASIQDTVDAAATLLLYWSSAKQNSTLALKEG